MAIKTRKKGNTTKNWEKLFKILIVAWAWAKGKGGVCAVCCVES